MISKLSLWVWIGAWVLAFIAGMVNVVGLLGFDHQAITHLTGTTSILGASLAYGEWDKSLHALGMLGFFVAGCAISGFVIQDSQLQLGRRYGVALLIVAALLFSSVYLLELKSSYGMFAAACACGIQNAMASTYSGAVIRTTHVSGMYTDLGIFLGHSIRGLAIDKKRFRLCCTVISGFLIGGAAGAVMFRSYGYSTLLFPAYLTAGTALSYALFKIRRGSN